MEAKDGPGESGKKKGKKVAAGHFQSQKKATTEESETDLD